MSYAFLAYVFFGATLTNAQEACTTDVHDAVAVNGEVLLQKQSVASQEHVTDDHDDNLRPGLSSPSEVVGLASSKSLEGVQYLSRASASPLSVRPGFAMKKPDLVEFGILVKKWYGIIEKEGIVNVDAVVTLHWSDSRVTKLIPAKASSVRISEESAKDKMWLPDVTVTNIAHGGNDLISSSVKVNSSGSVTKVDRVLLTLKQSIDTHDFPFDAQEVNIKIGSATYMLDEVRLVPIKAKSQWGVESNTSIFDHSAWNFVTQSLTAVTEVDGELEKSRGVLTVIVKRSFSQFVSSVFMPSAVFLVMTWSAFWLPLAGPFAMPRIALNAFALLCQVSVSQLADRQIPTTGGRAWMTEYLALCVQLQFTLALLNVIILRINHRESAQTLAGQLNWWMLVMYPLSTAFNICILGFGYVYASRACLAITLTAYVAGAYFKYRWHKEEQGEK